MGKSGSSKITYGICVCGNVKMSGKRRCAACSRSYQAFVQPSRDQRAREGKCPRCANGFLIPGGKGKKCETCYLKDTADRHLKDRSRWQELKALFESRPFDPYTGIPLYLGKNTELDHIIPVSVGGTEDLENLQWLHEHVNQLKSNYPVDEFLRHLDVLVSARTEFLKQSALLLTLEGPVF